MINTLKPVFSSKTLCKSNILDLQKVLEEKTGLSVSITNRKSNSGIISFEYKNLDQLDKIMNAIKNNY